MSFAQQFFSVAQGLIREKQKRERFQAEVIEEVCEAFETEVEARFVLEHVLSRSEAVRLLTEPATPNRRQRLLDIFSAEVNQSGIALWQDFEPKAGSFINNTVDIQLEVFGTIGEAATTDILGRRIDNLQSLIEKLKELKTTREEYLARVAAESRETCIERWESAGVPYELARELTDDMSVGAPTSSLRSQFEKSTVWLTGDFGVGKSLMIERLFQEAVNNAVHHGDAPIPVFLRARNIASDSRRLRDIVDTELSSLEDAKTQKVVIFVDGVDEASRNFADNLKTDVRTIQGTKPGTRAYITSRPVNSLKNSNSEQIVTVPTLDRDEQATLISRVAGEDVYIHYFDTYPETLKDAIRRPLFAILLGNYWRERSSRPILSRGELLSSLVRSSLQRSLENIEVAKEQLKRLAVLSVERDGSIQLAEVGPWLDIQPLLKSRLVVERGQTVEFPIPILAQWFAAQRLADDGFPFEQLLDDSQRLERWRYPLMVFISSTSHEAASKILAPVARKHPAFAATIVRESISDRGSGGALPPPREAGMRIRATMQAWVDGIGPLAELVAPVDRQNNKLRSLGICTRQNHLAHGWYYGSAHVNDVEIVPELCEWEAHKPGWLLGYGRVEGHQSSWAWQRTLKELTYQLEQLLKRHTLPIESTEGPYWEEAIWMLALKCSGKYAPPDYEPIEVSKLREWLHTAMRADRKATSKSGPDIYSLLEILHLLDSKGVTEVYWPWPKPDKPWGSWIWSPYSNERLLEFAKAVYSAALTIYSQFVQRWFPTFASELKLFAVTPGRIVALLEPPDLREEGVGPNLHWYVEHLDGRALPHIFKLADANLSRDKFWEERYARQEDEMRLTHPYAKRSRIFSGGIYTLDLHNKRPATELAYKWLWNDLKRIAWLDKHSLL